jgi:uncharacterized protein (DUF2062 family)
MNIKTFKLKVLQWISGKLGPLVTPIIAAFVGTTVGTIYSWIGDLLEKSPSIKSFLESVWTSLDSATQSALSPVAIGAMVAGIVYVVIQELINRYFVGEVKEDQKKLNEVLPLQEHLKVDGFLGPKTKAAKAKVLDSVQK